MTSWGRVKKGRGGPSPYRFFAVWAALIAALLAVSSFRGVPSGDGTVSVLRSEEIAAADAIAGTGAVPVLLEVSGGGDKEPGIVNGRWNFWEYIGDGIASALFGK